MKKLFIDNVLDLDSSAFIDGDDYQHLTRSLRIRIGEKFVVEDSSGKEYFCEVIMINSKVVEMKPISLFEREKIKNFEMTLYFPLLKGDRSELILQKATEIGVDNFIPVITKNTVIQLDKQNNKLKRWQTILKEAAMQSGRKGIPSIKPAVKLNEISTLASNECGFMGNFDGIQWKSMDKNFAGIKNIAIIMGPEGDFTPDEILTLKDKGFTAINFCDNILRSETACIFFVSVLSMFQ
ncbi:MAG: 16S rRNA (uracil(1498)-N(3))-methyltransferase [Spirochaetota bacterium]|nr:16S rRNA (uracil(1498)-N(3))-methyltransferase [Spirochaetota bacterium]